MAVFPLVIPFFVAASTFTGTIDADAGTSAIVAMPPAAEVPRVESGGGSGGSLYPAAPVLGTPAPTPAPSGGEVLGAQTTNVPENTASDRTASPETPATGAQPPSSQGSAGAPVAQVRTRQAPAVSAPAAELPKIEPEETADAQLAASGFLDFSWWWLLLPLFVLGAGYWAWRKYKEYKKRHGSAL